MDNARHVIYRYDMSVSSTRQVSCRGDVYVGALRSCMGLSYWWSKIEGWKGDTTAVVVVQKLFEPQRKTKHVT